ncbi:hypothetical protein SAMN02745146_2292 [Hymenobacter daecheongensis DSM 21074]|uniref:Uncharacterized protein n=1 Tax=Hymenobacter daecheongensis DSM 21074 TaxID=1121955 RepID=A0A1M6GK65_9BACT|nr:hypothetical protein [Hymenobacter daecheongensis]SHJ10312.1 hypothetical protein SAMN02745146_2292 [Hymenobacter daecheongensis DSM 21074]
MVSSLLPALAALLSGFLPASAPAVSASVPAFATALSQPATLNFWREVPAAEARRLGKPRLAPTRYRVFRLDLAGLQKELARADASSGPTVLLPLPNGTWPAFQLCLSGVMAPALAAKYPELRTYAGHAVAAPADYVRLETTPAGLRAMLVCAGRTYLLEPYRAGDTRHYICFDKALLPAGSKQPFEVPGRPVR